MSEEIEVINAPDKIYLYLGESGEVDFNTVFGEAEIPWSTEEIDDYDACYVPESRYAELKAENEELRRQLDWIPVGDRLPEEEDWYIATTANSRGYQVVEKLFFHLASKEWIGISDYKVIAWREMPAPYQGENEPLQTKQNGN